MSYALYSEPPCKDCEKRNARCHAECPDYLEWSKNQKEAESKACQSYRNEREISEYQLLAIEKNKRWRKR